MRHEIPINLNGILCRTKLLYHYTCILLQAVSRGQIQHWSTQKVEFKESPLNVDEKNLIEPIEKPKQSEIVRGQFTISLTLKTNESPRVTVRK